MGSSLWGVGWHVLAMRGGVRRPMATRCVAMPPNNLVDPNHRHPDRRAEGPERRDPFKQPFHKAPDAEPQHALQWG